MVITENKCMCNGGCGHEFHEGENFFRLITGSGDVYLCSDDCIVSYLDMTGYLEREKVERV